MIRTGEDYRAGLCDGREVWIDGERVQDVTCTPPSSRSSTSSPACTTWRMRHRPPV
jgi:aromatic ring hydroxylase